MKIFVYLVTFIVCIVILVNATVYTVEQSDPTEFFSEFQDVLSREYNDDTSDDTKPGDNEGEGNVELTPEEKEALEKEELKDLFGSLYSQYSPIAHEIQEEALKNILESSADLSNKKNNAYLTFVDAYTSALYDQITDLKGDGVADPDSPEETEKMNSFAETEAPAYDCFIDIMSGVVAEQENYDPSTEEINESVEAMILSVACKNTLDTLVQDPSLVETTQNGMTKLDPRVESDLVNALNAHLYDDDVSEGVCRGLATLLGLTLND